MLTARAESDECELKVWQVEGVIHTPMLNGHREKSESEHDMDDFHSSQMLTFSPLKCMAREIASSWNAWCKQLLLGFCKHQGNYGRLKDER